MPCYKRLQSWFKFFSFFFIDRLNHQAMENAHTPGMHISKKYEEFNWMKLTLMLIWLSRRLSLLFGSDICLLEIHEFHFVSKKASTDLMLHACHIIPTVNRQPKILKAFQQINSATIVRSLAHKRLRERRNYFICFLA